MRTASTTAGYRYAIKLPASLVLNIEFSNLLLKVVNHISGAPILLSYSDLGGTVDLIFTAPTGQQVTRAIRCVKALIAAMC